MAFIDYYKVLGVKKDATRKEIRDAHRRLIKIWHQDKNENPEAKQRSQEINEAYNVLYDPEKRKKYDEYGEHWKNADEFETYRQQQNEEYGGFNFGGFGDFSRTAGNKSGFSDFFESLFGSGRFTSTRNGATPGRDVQAEVSLSLREAAETSKRILDINGNSLRITIPAGISDGQKIRIKEQGEPSYNGGTRGDLYIIFHILPDPQFTRNGDDLYTTITVDLYTLLLGGEVIVPTLNGNVRMHIKPSTQPGSKLRLHKKGFPKYKKNNEYGDLIVSLKLQLPQLNERQKELLQLMKNSL